MSDTQAMHPHASVAARIQAYTGAIVMVAVSTLLGLWIAPRWGTAPVDMIYLPAVLAAAALWGLGPAVAAGLAAAHAARNATIAGFAGKLLSCSTEDDIAMSACDELRHLFDCNAMLVGG